MTVLLAFSNRGSLSNLVEPPCIRVFMVTIHKCQSLLELLREMMFLLILPNYHRNVEIFENVIFKFLFVL